MENFDSIRSTRPMLSTLISVIGDSVSQQLLFDIADLTDDSMLGFEPALMSEDSQVSSSEYENKFFYQASKTNEFEYSMDKQGVEKFVSDMTKPYGSLALSKVGLSSGSIEMVQRLVIGKEDHFSLENNGWSDFFGCKLNDQEIAECFANKFGKTHHF